MHSKIHTNIGCSIQHDTSTFSLKEYYLVTKLTLFETWYVVSILAAKVHLLNDCNESQSLKQVEHMTTSLTLIIIAKAMLSMIEQGELYLIFRKKIEILLYSYHRHICIL